MKDTHTNASIDSLANLLPADPVTDPLPDPEPAVPSLAEPDPGVFHHDPSVPRDKSDQ